MEYKPLDIVKLADRHGEYRVYSSPMAVNGKMYFASLTSDVLTNETKDRVIEVLRVKA